MLKTNMEFRKGILFIRVKGDLNKSTIRGVIDELAKLTGKNVSKEQSDKIVKAVVGDQIPNNLESMID